MNLFFRKDQRERSVRRKAAIRARVFFKVMVHAQPVTYDEEPVETELTRAARNSVDNADRITEAEEFQEVDFVPAAVERKEQHASDQKRKKAHSAKKGALSIAGSTL